MIWREKVDSPIYGSSQPFFNGFRFLELGVNNTIVFSLTYKHSKKWIPLVSGRFYFPLQNSGETLTKNFLKVDK